MAQALKLSREAAKKHMDVCCSDCSDYKPASSLRGKRYALSGRCMLCADLDAHDCYNAMCGFSLRDVSDQSAPPILVTIEDYKHVSATWRDSSLSRELSESSQAQWRDAYLKVYGSVAKWIYPLSQLPDAANSQSEARGRGMSYYVVPHPCTKCGSIGVRHAGSGKCYVCIDPQSGTTTATTRKRALSAGLRFYETGRPCVLGHVSKRYASTGACLMCKEGG